MVELALAWNPANASPVLARALPALEATLAGGAGGRRATAKPSRA
jgi:hypothetical protein